VSRRPGHGRGSCRAVGGAPVSEPCPLRGDYISEYESQGQCKHSAPGEGGRHGSGSERGDEGRGRATSLQGSRGWGVGCEASSGVAAEHPSLQVKLLELQKLVLPLVCNHEGHDKFPSAAQNRGDEPAPGAPAPQELGAAEEQGDLCEVSLADSVEPAAGEAREGSPRGNPTAEKIVQLLPVMQDTQEHPGLASKPCVPFFYRAAENREINIVII
uniref:Golgin subfamily A conserved domain-containing protein n=1 Tax=Macaca fascicularis TaxID=9541 RepID=A0A7N9D4D5_MACFA